MISFKEVTGDYTLADIPLSHQINIQELLKRVNVIREKWGRPMVVTSGYRTMQDHLRIYSKKGITDHSKIPMASNHLYGRALDVSDPKGELQEWIKLNLTTLMAVGLYCEDFSYTKTWVHFQSVAPKSGKRFFIP